MKAKRRSDIMFAENEEKMWQETAKGLPCFHPIKTDMKNDEELEEIIAQTEALPEGLREELRGRIIKRLTEICHESWFKGGHHFNNKGICKYCGKK